MAKKKQKAAAAAGAVYAARQNPYVQRVIEDEDLRDNVRVAFEAARNAYARLSNGKAPTKVVMDDKRFHKDLQTAADALKDAGSALKEGPKKKRRGGFMRKLLVLAIGAGIALALSEELRSKVLDALFGKEEEFDYGSTAPSTPPQTSAA
jgi:hypothetical protein